MMNLLKALRQDEYGVILSTEIVIIGSLLVIGLITGLTCLQKSVNGELQDLAGAIGQSHVNVINSSNTATATATAEQQQSEDREERWSGHGQESFGFSPSRYE